MPKPNYAFQKRQRELAKKQKKEAKQRNKAAEQQQAGGVPADGEVAGATPAMEPSKPE